ncbi:restriction endonuclease subunit S [Porphyromonas catoniae]|uniref:restriction endonuclease subunit S n=1 Tax=Porphyromonas catoniae TaxID=41976 RepID=UPI0023F0345B|nr:restriction endonuclease subunit S [Porphyromonas catoniae]
MKKKKPKIRFKEFEGEWAFYAFRCLFTEKRDKTQEEFEDQLLSCAIDGIYLNSELFNHFRGSTTIGYLKVKKNDLILSAQNLHLGNANVNLRFASGIISPAYKVYAINGDNPYFINAWVKSEHAKSLFMSATTEGASLCRKNIEWEFLYDKKVCIPSISEQEKIGAFLTTLDKLIEKFEAKLDKLRKLKHALLENMFVDALSGESVPQIRFKGYTDKWEVKELREVAKLRRGLTYSPDDVCSERKGIRVLRSSNISEDIFLLSEDDVFVKQSAINIPYIHNYDILITAANGSSRLVGKHCIVADIQSNSCVPGGFMLCASTDSPFFLQASMSSSWYQTFIATYTLGGNGTIGNLSKTALEKQRFQLPSISEQEKIGNCFAQIDTLFSKTSIKLTKLRYIKQSLLEKMFV